MFVAILQSHENSKQNKPWSLFLFVPCSALGPKVEDLSKICRMTCAVPWHLPLATHLVGQVIAAD